MEAQKKNLVKKIALYTAIAIAVIFVFVTLVGTYKTEIALYLGDMRDQRILAAHQREEQELLELYKNDYVGGATPEETFDLFLAALNAGNIETASKYYVPVYQEEALNNLEKELREDGNFDKTIKYFAVVRENGAKSCADVETDIGGCVFEYIYKTTVDRESMIVGSDDRLFIPKGSEERKTVGFWLNSFNKIWKITHPY